MHELIHLASRAALIVVTAVLFTSFLAVRPGRQSSWSRPKLVGILVIGALIGLVFWTTQSLYVTPPPT